MLVDSACPQDMNPLSQVDTDITPTSPVGQTVAPESLPSNADVHTAVTTTVVEPPLSVATSRHRRSARKPATYEPETGKWLKQ